MFQTFRLNRIKCLILFLLCIFFTPNIKALVSSTDEFYVNDYANILSEETKNYIIDKSQKLDNLDDTQVVVVTVKNLEGLDIESYANQLFRNFEIGSEETNKGLLLLISLEDRTFRVEVGYGLEGILPDGKTARIQDTYIVPYLESESWDEGIKNGYDAFIKEIVTLNNLDLDFDEPTEEVENEDSNFFFEAIVFIGVICGAIIRMLSKDKKKLYQKIYLLIWGIIMLLGIFFFTNIIVSMIINLIAFLLALCGIHVNVSGGGTSSSRRTSGKGGSSGGGGSTRKF